jgi:adenylate kinase family enzyme
VSEENRLRLDRVAVVGTSAAGKSSFARRLATMRACAHVELDALYWSSDWVPRPPDQFHELVAKEVAGDRWIVDGNYGVVRPLVWERATAVIWLDYSFATVFGRVLARTAQRWLRRETLFSGNRESLRMTLMSRDSILWWVITTFHRRRREYHASFEDPHWAPLHRVRLRRPRDAERFLNDVAVREGVLAAVEPPSMGV